MKLCDDDGDDNDGDGMAKPTLTSNTINKLINQPTRVTFSPWDQQDNHIGLEAPPSGHDETDYIGATKTTTYLMPKSTLVKANRATERAVISHYNDRYFALTKSTSTPDVPFGGRFVARTQIVVVNLGRNRCRMICSVEAEFPNGEPFGLGRSIRNGMKAGSMDAFEKIRDTILELCPG